MFIKHALKIELKIDIYNALNHLNRSLGEPRRPMRNLTLDVSVS